MRQLFGADPMAQPGPEQSAGSTRLLGSAGNIRVLRALAAGQSPQAAPQLAVVVGLTPQGTRIVLDVLVHPIVQRPVLRKILRQLGLDPQPPPRGRAHEAGGDFAR